MPFPRGQKAANAKALGGQRFSRLVVVGRAAKLAGDRRLRWLCRCDCGRAAVVRGDHLRSGMIVSCGCYRDDDLSANRYVHGEANRTVEYRCWTGLKDRCLNPNYPDWGDYGGRGIGVCERWQESFENFLEEMGRKPGPEYSIDRIDVDGNYDPDNCRWATPSQQANNRRSNRSKGQQTWAF